MDLDSVAPTVIFFGDIDQLVGGILLYVVRLLVGMVVVLVLHAKQSINKFIYRQLHICNMIEFNS